MSNPSESDQDSKGRGIDQLVFVSRVSRTEKDDLFRVAETFQDESLKDEFQTTIHEVVNDRLILAFDLLTQARGLLSSEPSDIELRTAVNRAYYSAHHSLRAILLYHNGWDPVGHESSIEELEKALKDGKFCAETGLAPGTDKEMIEARRNRHIADYSPYSVMRASKGAPEMLTGNSWESAAGFNLALASKGYEGAYKFLGR